MSLFKRPAWAKTQSIEHPEKDTEDNIFSHSSRSYGEIVEEEQRKKRERAERQKMKLERKESGKLPKLKAGRKESGKQSPKRRRITSAECAELFNSVGMGNAIELSDDEGDMPIRKSLRLNSAAASDDSRFAASLIGDRAEEPAIGSDDSDDDTYVASRRPRVVTPVEEAEEESDEEFAEMKRQIQERRRKEEEKKKKKKKKSCLPDLGSSAGDEGHSTYPTPPTLDPPIKLFISSTIPNTQPLIVYRKLSQRLQEIREVWCKKQDFSDDKKDSIFLIHNMHRIYDVTTCKSLGLDVDADGVVTMMGMEGIEGLEKVHLEAVTEQIFREMKAERAKQERKRHGLSEPEEGIASDAKAPQCGAKPGSDEPLIKVFLRVKGKDEPFKLKVKPSTPFSKIIHACRNHYGVGEYQDLRLEFDGENLEPKDDVQSAEIEDLNCIDVYIS